MKYKHKYTAEQKAIIRAYRTAYRRLVRVRTRYFGDTAGRFGMEYREPTYAEYKAAIASYDAATALLVAKVPQYLYE